MLYKYLACQRASTLCRIVHIVQHLQLLLWAALLKICFFFFYYLSVSKACFNERGHFDQAT